MVELVTYSAVDRSDSGVDRDKAQTLKPKSQEAGLSDNSLLKCCPN
jgi:hypothetical protein